MSVKCVKQETVAPIWRTDSRNRQRGSAASKIAATNQRPTLAVPRKHKGRELVLVLIEMEDLQRVRAFAYL